jgi:chromosome segregation ATPase|tara:strand:+ start:4188 stop:4967 length:780 start_codon:yes stop_codon:yes gene_type:complete
MDIKEQILVALGLNKDEEVKFAYQAKTEDGTMLVSTADELEAGVDISVMTDEGTTMKLPVGLYKLDTGVTFKVEEEGIVSEVMKKEEEEEMKDEEKDKEKKEMTADEAYEKAEFEDKDKDKDEYDHEPGHESDAEKADWAKSYEVLKDKVENLEDAIADIKAKMGESKEEEVEMSEEVVEEKSDSPKTVTTKTTEVVEFSKEDVEALKAENEKLKTELSESPAESPLNTNKFSTEKKPLTKRELNRMTKQERFWYNTRK